MMGCVEETVRYVDSPKDDKPVRKIIQYSQQRTSYGDALLTTFSIKDPSGKAYHKCYRNVVNSTNLRVVKMTKP